MFTSINRLCISVNLLKNKWGLSLFKFIKIQNIYYIGRIRYGKIKKIKNFNIFNILY